MILHDLCLMPAQFHYVIIYIPHLERNAQLAEQCATWIYAKGTKIPVLQVLKFQKVGTAANYKAGEA
jgi:hypothetical protein